ncbi:MAG: hypothetical protein WA005_01105 [Candidatus Binataceae bacterium]
MLALAEAAPTLRPAGLWLCYIFAALEIATGAQRLIFGHRELRRCA